MILYSSTKTVFTYLCALLVVVPTFAPLWCTRPERVQGRLWPHNSVGSAILATLCMSALAPFGSICWCSEVSLQHHLLEAVHVYKYSVCLCICVSDVCLIMLCMYLMFSYIIVNTLLQLSSWALLLCSTHHRSWSQPPEPTFKKWLVLWPLLIHVWYMYVYIFPFMHTC